MNNDIFFSELKKVSKQIDNIIFKEAYPNEIMPVYLKEAVKAYPARGGKRLRPALVLWTCGLIDGDPNAAIYPAAAIEIYHNWTLVHDDIIDDDDTRRGKPAVHKIIKKIAEKQFPISSPQSEVFGKNIAILAGDIQQGWAISLMLKAERSGIPEHIIIEIIRKMCEDLHKGLLCGETTDVEFAFRTTSEISEREIIEMLALKTGKLLEFAAYTGITIGNFTANKHKKSNDKFISAQYLYDISTFAKFAGIAFQLKDDYLGIFGDPEKTGKPVCSDISEGKKTLLTVKALQNLPSEKQKELSAFIGQPVFSLKEVEQIRSLIKESGAHKYILSLANEFAEKAYDHLNNLPNNFYRTLLENWLHFLTLRNI